VTATAAAAGRIIAGFIEVQKQPEMVNEELELPEWRLPCDHFSPPREILETTHSLSHLPILLKLCERSFRVYGRWNGNIRENLMQVLNCLLDFIRQFAERTRNATQERNMRAAYMKQGSKFRRVYTTILKDVIMTEEEYTEFVKIVTEEQQRLKAFAEEKVEQDGEQEARQIGEGEGLDLLLNVYCSAYTAMDDLDAFCRDVAEATGVTFKKAPLKRFWRSLEKMVLKYSEDDDISHAALDLKDVARGALQGNMTQLTAAFAKMRTDKRIQIVRIKNRFDELTEMGWADCQVMLYFTHSPDRHICEIQLVHDQLMTVRIQGAHKEYASVRAAAEIMSLHNQEVPSLDPKRSAYLCKLKPSIAVSFPPQFAGDRQPCRAGSPRLIQHPTGHRVPDLTPMCVAFGMQDPSAPLGGRVSLRWEDPEVIVFDSPMCLAPLHLEVVPTAWRIPDWKHLLVKPKLAREVIAKLRRAALEATARMLSHDQWRDRFFKAPAEGWPTKFDAETLRSFCDQHAITGFRYPPSQDKQLTLHWIIPPVFPWHWGTWNSKSRNDEFVGSKRWIPLEILDNRLVHAEQGHHVGDLGATMARGNDSRRSSLESMATFAKDFEHSLERYSVAQKQLAHWGNLFDFVAVDKDMVRTIIDNTGTGIETDHKVEDVQVEDVRNLATFGQPYDGSQPKGTFYGFPRQPEGVSLEFVMQHGGRRFSVSTPLAN